MASSLINGTTLDAATLLAILLERAGGELLIPEDAIIAYIDHNRDVSVEHTIAGGLLFSLLGKDNG